MYLVSLCLVTISSLGFLSRWFIVLRIRFDFIILINWEVRVNNIIVFLRWIVVEVTIISLIVKSSIGCLVEIVLLLDDANMRLIFSYNYFKSLKLRQSTSLSRSPAIFAPALLLWALPAAILKAPICLKRSKICFFGATKDTVLSKVPTSHFKCLAIVSDSAQWVLLHHVQVNFVPHQVPDVVNPISGGKIFIEIIYNSYAHLIMVGLSKLNPQAITLTSSGRPWSKIILALNWMKSNSYHGEEHLWSEHATVANLNPLVKARMEGKDLHTKSTHLS